MSEERDPQLSPDAERARTALRATEPPLADATFRERLKEEFVSGAIAARATSRAFPRRRARWLPWAAAAAAAVAAVILASLINRGSAWTVTATTGAGEVRVDGESIAIGQLEALRSHVRPGVEVEV